MTVAARRDPVTWRNGSTVQLCVDGVEAVCNKWAEGNQVICAEAVCGLASAVVVTVCA